MNDQLPLFGLKLKSPSGRVYFAVAMSYTGHKASSYEELIKLLDSQGPKDGGEVWVSKETYKMLEVSHATK